MFNNRDTVIVGYPGRLARAFATQWPEARHVGRTDFDIMDRSSTVQSIVDLQPKLVINCAALTDIARCEREPDLAWAVNVRGVRHLAEACRRVDATLVHFSSDYALDPVNEYGWTKRASESLAHLTIRAKIYDGSHWAWVALRQGQPIRMLMTEFLNPISISSVTSITEQILLHQLRGLVAVGTLERLSFWQVGRVWAEALDVDPDLVQPIDSMEFSFPRLNEMFLDTTPLMAIGISMPRLFEDALQHRKWYFSLVGNEVL
jgi:dTDP-4-dehydrorhamnose reductase